ncbi:binding-protein-dependent transport systems inner membrane component [Mycolicibacterium canariasense]|uniref:Binding-protein-dependent transport systems inner membrane component n=1 Tax=Mycolicibacterium canariasense TaxID=228230 RepID=A0A124E1Q6_MYCCR|nr:hypothetical protein [Mycolicibacterium canariasense]MCV7208800.1 hypothetical protein [Mycolicibacterium canariasense]ORV07134.1 hypothetical protein AWB94_14120 [Mycolicibacterium canariasense]GAS94413.1 binding-protein-dependent transport systems inner membrane component [Mycolicibacterium canariasense]
MSAHAQAKLDRIRRIVTTSSVKVFDIDVVEARDILAVLDDPEPQPQPAARTVHTLGPNERNSIWQCVKPLTWPAYYAWVGDDITGQWIYTRTSTPGLTGWSESNAGPNDVTARTVGPCGDLDHVTFIEVLRLQPAGEPIHFAPNGKVLNITAGQDDELLALAASVDGLRGSDLR